MLFVGQHATKINRAVTLSDWGAYPNTFQAALAHIPDGLLARLTGAEIAQVVDALCAAHADGRAAARREALDEGGIYDSRTSAFRTLVA